MNYFNYYTEIEETFVRRRGKHLFLSPIDWALIEVWQERGIPLHIVLRSIESVFDVFDKQPIGTRTIKSLFYCREEIEVQYGEWARAQAGSSKDGEQAPGIERADVVAFIERAIAELRGVELPEIREDLDRAIERLAELAADPGDDNERIDATLRDVEELLERSMLSNWEPAHLNKVREEVALQLKPYKKEMEPAAYQTTFDLMLLKALREFAGIPRLGLYYV